jgi:hypothetical protein
VQQQQQHNILTSFDLIGTSGRPASSSAAGLRPVKALGKTGGRRHAAMQERQTGHAARATDRWLFTVREADVNGAAGSAGAAADGDDDPSSRR